MEGVHRGEVATSIWSWRLLYLWLSDCLDQWIWEMASHIAQCFRNVLSSENIYGPTKPPGCRVSLCSLGAMSGSILEEFVLHAFSTWGTRVVCLKKKFWGKKISWDLYRQVIQYLDLLVCDNNKTPLLKLAWTITRLRDKAWFLTTASKQQQTSSLGFSLKFADIIIADLNAYLVPDVRVIASCELSHLILRNISVAIIILQFTHEKSPALNNEEN